MRTAAVRTCLARTAGKWASLDLQYKSIYIVQWRGEWAQGIDARRVNLQLAGQTSERARANHAIGSTAGGRGGGYLHRYREVRSFFQERGGAVISFF